MDDLPKIKKIPEKISQEIIDSLASWESDLSLEVVIKKTRARGFLIGPQVPTDSTKEKCTTVYGDDVVDSCYRGIIIERKDGYHLLLDTD